MTKKVIAVRDITMRGITTDDDEYPDYRRYRNGSWEVLMGPSWESLSPDEEEVLEAAYQEFMK